MAAKAWKWYVYELSDAEGVFYVGKGSGLRIVHTRSEGGPRKLFRAKDCTATIIAYFKSQADALEYEKERMLEYEGLTNVSGYRGCLSLEKIQEHTRYLSSCVFKSVFYTHPEYGPMREWAFDMFEICSERILKCHEVGLARELVGLLEFVTAKLLRCSQPLTEQESHRSRICSV